MIDINNIGANAVDLLEGNNDSLNNQLGIARQNLDNSIEVRNILSRQAEMVLSMMERDGPAIEKTFEPEL